MNRINRGTKKVIKHPIYCMAIMLIGYSLFIGCQSDSKSTDMMDERINIVYEPNEDVKDIVLNIAIEPREQLFHVEPIIKKRKNSLNGKDYVVGLIALVGRPYPSASGDSVDSISFRIVNDPANPPGENLNLESTELVSFLKVNVMDTLSITSTPVAGAKSGATMFKFSNPAPRGYMCDIKFAIPLAAFNEDSPIYRPPISFTAPRVCTWTFI